jgi:hypothetical protein
VYEEDIKEYHKSLTKDSFNQGIVKDRNVTDCLCSVVFLQFLNVMCVLLGWIIYHGHTEKLYAPISYVARNNESEWTLLTRPEGIE